MNLTIELPDDLEAALKAKAMAQGVSLAGFTFENRREMFRGFAQDVP